MNTKSSVYWDHCTVSVPYNFFNISWKFVLFTKHLFIGFFFLSFHFCREIKREKHWYQLVFKWHSASRKYMSSWAYSWIIFHLNTCFAFWSGGGIGSISISISYHIMTFIKNHIEFDTIHPVSLTPRLDIANSGVIMGAVSKHVNIFHLIHSCCLYWIMSLNQWWKSFFSRTNDESQFFVMMGSYWW